MTRKRNTTPRHTHETLRASMKFWRSEARKQIAGIRNKPPIYDTPTGREFLASCRHWMRHAIRALNALPPEPMTRLAPGVYVNAPAGTFIQTAPGVFTRGTLLTAAKLAEGDITAERR